MGPPNSGAARTIIGAANIHICAFCLINFFWNRLFLQSVNTNIWIFAPSIIVLPAPVPPNCRQHQEHWTNSTTRTKYMLGLPYRCRDTYKERLLLTYWHEYLDMVQLFKIINNIAYVDKDIVPKVKTTRKSTRSGDKFDGTLVLEEQLCRTCTYARSYMVRSKRV